MKQHLLAGTFGAIALVSAMAWTSYGAAQAISFTPPADNSAPSQATGGASRGSFNFTPPSDNAAPSQATGGASRSGFIPPVDNSAPSQATGGASRGNFMPPADNSAPSQATGGASRGNFMPPADNSAPTQATGGASRGNFMPPTDNSAPQQATGGASRGTFIPATDNAAPLEASGGASRGTFTPPSRNQAPRQTVGGASRSDFIPNETDTMAPQIYGESQQGGQSGAIAANPLMSMMALTPQSFYGTTLSARPTIMVYIPASNAKEAVFSIKDEQEKMHYQMRVPVEGKSGVIAVQLPVDMPELEVGKNYHWFMALVLDGSLSPSSPFVDAWVKRIEPSVALANALASGDAHQNAETLATEGVWYDSAALLAMLYQTQPGNDMIASDWNELLTSVGLNDIASAAISQ
ncbi:MAG: DUF928 domain-containing protein [Oculatellaceae cyanobacterium Prado106]|nr:DUF928 domain-containing protein [Oculatellaceae cyanobacterium Prado106]